MYKRLESGRGLLFLLLCDGIRIDGIGNDEAQAYESQEAEGEFEERTSGVLFHIRQYTPEDAYNEPMRHLVFAITLFLIVPALSLAAETGFPSQTIWASKVSAVEGETIVLSTVVQNGSSEALQGTLVFAANGGRVSAREFELAGGESQIHSAEWRPEAGEYRVSAIIEGTSADLARKETPPITIVVAEPPAPSALQETVSQTVQALQIVASSSIPVVQNIGQTIFSQTEALRQAGIERLETYLAKQGGGQVAGASTSSPRGTSTVDGLKDGSGGPAGESMFSKVKNAAAAAALTMFNSMALFYPLLILLFLGGLYLLARRVRRKPSD